LNRKKRIKIRVKNVTKFEMADSRLKPETPERKSPSFGASL
jgi:hypothetical protein